MAREKENARDVREDLAKMFGDKKLLNVSEMIRFTGLSRPEVKKQFKFIDGYTSVYKNYEKEEKKEKAGYCKNSYCNIDTYCFYLFIRRHVKKTYGGCIRL